MTIRPLRFFTIVGLHSSYLLVVMAAAALAGVAMLLTDSSKGAAALAPLALVQMFAAASGFTVPARRGHLDLLFTGGAPRLSIALTHFASAVVPGLSLWLMVGMIELVAARDVAPRAFTSGTVVVFVLVSAAPWALTVGLPRLSGAIGWLLMMAVWRAAALPDRGAVGVAMNPFALLGQQLTGEQVAAAFPATLVALLLPAVAVGWIVHMDVPLESAQ